MNNHFPPECFLLKTNKTKSCRDDVRCAKNTFDLMENVLHIATIVSHKTIFSTFLYKIYRITQKLKKMLSIACVIVQFIVQLHQIIY
jgi:hypothetical protein